MRTRSCLIVVAAVSILASSLHAQPANKPDWPTWRGPNRDGKSADSGLLKAWPEGGPALLWKATGVGEGFSGVAVADGKVFITGSIDGNLMLSAFDMQGNRQWTVTHGPAWTRNYPGARATPTIDDGRLYLLSGPGKIACYDVRDGKELWHRSMSDFGGRVPGWGYSDSVLIARNLAVIHPGGRQCVVALDKTTGKTLWTSPGNGAGAHYSASILTEIDGMPMIIAANGGGIFAVHPQDGRVLWTNDFCAGNTANCPTPAVEGNLVFWANGYGKGGICLEVSVKGNDADAKELWRTNEMVCHHGGYIIHEGYIYGNHQNGWTCLELKTGKRMWFDRGVGKGSLCFADGMLYTFGERGGRAGLVEATPEAFRTSGGFSVEGQGVSWAHPVVTGGRLYLRYADTLYCFDVTQ